MVAVSLKSGSDGWAVEESLRELSQLAATAGVRVVAKVTQRLAAPSKALYIGRGKINELLSLRQDNGYDVVILDDELTPVQQRNLENALEVKVIDRTA